MTHQIIHSFTDIDIPSSAKGVLIDLDNTCYYYEPCHGYAIQKAEEILVSNLGKRVDDFNKRYTDAQTEVKLRIPTHGASHSRLLYFHTLLSSLQHPEKISLALTLEQTYWETFLSSMQPVPGLYDFLANCNEHGTKVLVLSDLTTQIQFQKIVALGLETFIDHIVTSEEAGAEKPDSRPFILGMEKLQLKANEVLMIGDSLERDIHGAEAQGITAIQIIHDTNTHQPSV